jgi:hypothetical protein
MALLKGKGDFGRTIGIAVMAGTESFVMHAPGLT